MIIYILLLAMISLPFVYTIILNSILQFDFGLARVVKRRNRVNARYEMTGETGSMRYMAPEVSNANC